VKPRVALGDTSAGTVRTASQNVCSSVRGIAAAVASFYAVHHGRSFGTRLYDGKPPLKSIALVAFPQADPAQGRRRGRDKHGHSARFDRQHPQFACGFEKWNKKKKVSGAGFTLMPRIRASGGSKTATRSRRLGER